MMMNELIYKYFTVRNIVVFLVLLLLAIFAFKNPDVTLMFFAAIVVSCSLNPMVDRLNKKMPRPLAAGIVLGSFILLLAIFILPIFIIGAYQVFSFSDAFPNYIEDIDHTLHNNPILHSLGIGKENVAAYFAAVADHAGEYFDRVVIFVRSCGTALVYLLITAIFTYFFMADTVLMKENFLRLFPTSMRSRTEEILDIIERKMGGYITAQAYAIASVGVVMTVGLLLFNVKYAILLGLITAVLDIIPVAGPTLALIICVIATYKYGTLPVIGVIVSFAAAQIIENNLVRPMAFSKLLNTHPLMIFLFLFIAAKYFGVVGALFAPAMATMVCVLIEELYIKNIE